MGVDTVGLIRSVEFLWYQLLIVFLVFVDDHQKSVRHVCMKRLSERMSRWSLREANRRKAPGWIDRGHYTETVLYVVYQLRRVVRQPNW